MRSHQDLVNEIVYIIENVYNTNNLAVERFQCQVLHAFFDKLNILLTTEINEIKDFNKKVFESYDSRILAARDKAFKFIEKIGELE